MTYVPVIIRRHNHFVLKDVIERTSYEGKGVESISNLIDFLPSITRFKRDQDILAGWKKHFDDRNIPWAVTMKPGSDITVLWKEDVT